MALTAQEIMMLGSGVYRGGNYSGNGAGARAGAQYMQMEQLAWQKDKERLRIAEAARVRAQEMLKESMDLEGQGRYAEAEARKASLRDAGYNPETLEYTPDESYLPQQTGPQRNLWQTVAGAFRPKESTAAQVSPNVPGGATVAEAVSPPDAPSSEDSLTAAVDAGDYDFELAYNAAMEAQGVSPGSDEKLLGYDQGSGQPERLDMTGVELRDSTIRDVAGTELDPGLPVFAGREGMPLSPDLSLASEGNRLGLSMTTDEALLPQSEPTVLQQELREKYGSPSLDGSSGEATVEGMDPYEEYSGPMDAPLQPSAGQESMREKLSRMRKERRADWYDGMGQQYPEGESITQAGREADMTLEASISATNSHYADLMKGRRAELVARRPGAQVNIKHSDARGGEKMADDLVKQTLVHWEIPGTAAALRAAREGVEAVLSNNPVLQSSSVTRMVRANGDVRPSDADITRLVDGIARKDVQLANYVRDVMHGSTKVGPIEMTPERATAFSDAFDEMQNWQMVRLENGYEALVRVAEGMGSDAEYMRVLQHIQMRFPDWYHRDVENGRMPDITDRARAQVAPPDRSGQERYKVSPEMTENQEQRKKAATLDRADIAKPSNSTAKDTLKAILQRKKGGN